MKVKTKKLLNKIGRFVYAIVGISALISLIWAIYTICLGIFCFSMHLWSSLLFFILIIGGLNWGIKAIFKKDIFGN